MIVTRTVAECRAAVANCGAAGARLVGLVPTMGAFHDGHLELMRRAREKCGIVVVSLFVNPTQFGDPRDLAAYPRDEPRDVELASAAGVDVLFAPTADEIYPDGFATSVSVAGVSEPLEGKYRGASHFRGVTTVVTKLLAIVRPDVSYFGQKDAQQVAVVRRLIRDLHLPGEMVVVPTVRERSGLALSSRNARLSAAERARAVSLSRALFAMEREMSAGERRVAALLEVASCNLDVDRLDYLEIVDPETFLPVQQVDRAALAVVAAHIGGVRLIDNVRLVPASLSRVARSGRTVRRKR